VRLKMGRAPAGAVSRNPQTQANVVTGSGCDTAHGCPIRQCRSRLRS